MRLPAAVQVPWNSCHSPAPERDSDTWGARLHAVITRRPASAIVRTNESRRFDKDKKRHIGSLALIPRREVNRLLVAPTSVTVMVGLLADYRTIFAITNPMSTDDMVATIPGSMKLWLSTYLPIFVVPV